MCHLGKACQENRKRESLQQYPYRYGSYTEWTRKLKLLLTLKLPLIEYLQTKAQETIENPLTDSPLQHLYVGFSITPGCVCCHHVTP